MSPLSKITLLKNKETKKKTKKKKLAFQRVGPVELRVNGL